MLRKIAAALVAATIAVAPVMAVAATPVDTVAPTSGKTKSIKSAKKAGKHKQLSAKHDKAMKLSGKSVKKIKHAKGKSKKPLSDKSAT